MIEIQVDHNHLAGTLATLHHLLENQGKVRATLYYQDGHKNSRRLTVHHEGFVMLYAKNSKWYGYRFTTSALEKISRIKLQIMSEAEKHQSWQRSWEKVTIKLKKSGWFPAYYENVLLGLAIGREKILQANEVYWLQRRLPPETHNTDLLRRLEAIDPRLVHLDAEGNPRPNTSILWEMSRPAQVKKMYFGKYQNEQILAQIKEAVEKRAALHISAQAGYDVSFSYRPEINSAWYSEEYRDCGNGHYFIALDETHALFIEDD